MPGWPAGEDDQDAGGGFHPEAQLVLGDVGQRAPEPLEQRFRAHCEDRVVSLSLARVGVAHGAPDDAAQRARLAGPCADGADHGPGERGGDRLQRGVVGELAVARGLFFDDGSERLVDDVERPMSALGPPCDRAAPTSGSCGTRKALLIRVLSSAPETIRTCDLSGS